MKKSFAVLTGLLLAAASTAPAQFTVNVSSDWAVNTSVYSVVINGNQVRGLSFNGTNVVVAVGNTSTTAPNIVQQDLFLLDGTNGALLNGLGTSAQDTFDIDANGATTTFNIGTGTVGPYDLARDADGNVYGCGFTSTTAPNRNCFFRWNATTGYSSEANPQAVGTQLDLAGTANVGLRGFDVIGSGTGTRIYAFVNNAAGVATAVRIYTTADGNSFTSAELINLTTPATNPVGPNMIIAKKSNTGGDGDVFWTSTSGNHLQRYVRSGGTWARDFEFNGAFPHQTAALSAGYGVSGGDYVTINGEDVLVVMRTTATVGEVNKIYFVHGTTGATLGSIQPPQQGGTPGGTDTNAGNADLAVVASSATAGSVYYGAPDRRTVGKLSYSYGSAVTTSAVTPGQVVINEIGTLEPGTDDNEFVELYGPAGTSLDDLEILVMNSSIGITQGTQRSFPLDGRTIPADGIFVMQAGPTDPGADYYLGAHSNVFENGDPDGVVLRKRSTKQVIDAVSYFTNYATTPGTATLVGTVPYAYEGDPVGAGGDDTFNTQLGLTTGTARIDTSVGRYPDGADTNNNFTDFQNQWMARTPGTANFAGAVAAPQTESFATATGASLNWAYTVQPIQFQGIGATTPVIGTGSPDPTTPNEVASVKDPAGGGDEAIITNFNAKNYGAYGAFYVGNISAIVDGNEIGTFYARYSNGFQNNSTSAADIDSPTGTYGDSFFGFHVNYVTGVISAVRGEKSVLTTVASSSPVAPGWVILGLNMEGGEVRYMVGGNQLASISALPAAQQRYGTVAVGYRETSTGSTGQVRNNFDYLRILAPQPDVHVTAASFDAGTVDTGNFADVTVNVANLGLDTLDISSITRTGGSTDFALQGAAPTAVNEGANTNITVRFSPTAGGASSATFTVASDDPTTPAQEFTVTGTGNVTSVSDWSMMEE